MVEVLPLSLLLLVGIFELCIFEGKLQSLDFGLLTLFHVLWVVRKDFQSLRNHQFGHILEVKLLFLVNLLLNESQHVQFNDFLGVVLLVPDVITLLVNSLDCAGVELTVL